MKAFRIGKLSGTLLMLVLAWMVCVGSHAALAQSCVTTPPQPTDCYESISVQSGQFGWNWPPKGAILYCPAGVPTGAAYYFLRNNKCPSKPKCLECERLAGGHVAGGGPIEFASGDTYIAETDVRLPGLGGGLTLSRTWNSILFDGVAQLGMLGFRWASNFEESIYISGNGLIQYLRGDGGIWQFANGGSVPNGNLYVPVSHANEAVTLTQTQTNWTVQLQNGEHRIFDLTSGKLLSISDRNGNTTTLSYDGYITAVLDNNGKVLESHTYDSSGRGLTSSRAGGAEGITVSYPQPQSYGGVFLTQ